MAAREKVVVTGGAGFIGSHLVDALIARGFDVHVIDNYAGGRREDRINQAATYHERDVRHYEEIAPIIKGARYVFHEAALPRVQYSIEHPDLTNETNVTGTLNVLLAARTAKVAKVIYAASGGSVYGDVGTMAFTEDMPPRPISPYGLQKHISELYCRVFSNVYGLPVVSLRYFNVYGPKADPDGAYALVVAKFIKQRMEGKPMTITGDGTQTRDFTHVRDVVRANLLAAESGAVGKGEIINIGAGRPVSVNKVAALIGGPTAFIAARLEPHDAYADNALAKKLLGWSPEITLEEGVAELKKEIGLI